MGEYALKLGLKSGMDFIQVRERLKYNPKTFEFHLTWDDLYNMNGLDEKIKFLYSSGVDNVILHQPKYKSKGNYFNLYTKEYISHISFSTNFLSNICNENINTKIIIHPFYEHESKQSIDITEELQNISEYIELLKTYSDNILYENGISDTLSYHNEQMIDFIIDNDLPISYDISNAYISCNGDMELLINSLNKLKNNIKNYHIADSDGFSHNKLELGAGTIDWIRVLNSLNDEATVVFEIDLDDNYNCKPMINSFKFLEDKKTEL